MRKLVVFLQNVSTGRAVLGFFIPALLIYSIMLLYTIPRVEQFATGMKLFDLSAAGYSHTYALELLAALGVNGRDVYLYQQLPLDFIYPGLFAISCCLLLSWLFAKSFKPDSGMFYLCLLPVAAGLFDYLENISIVVMLRSYPDVTEFLVSLASFLLFSKADLQ